MATSTYLSNPDVLLNGTVSLTDQCKSAVLNRTVEALESTAFGGVARVYTGGLENNELTLSLYMSYAASETYASLKSIVGTSCSIIVSPQAPTTPGTYSATNPGFTLTGTYLETLPVMSANMGELAVIDITFKGGTYTADES